MELVAEMVKEIGFSFGSSEEMSFSKEKFNLNLPDKKSGQAEYRLMIFDLRIK